MKEQWPPKGHHFVYRVTEDLDNAIGATYEMTMPKGIAEFNLTTVRVGRLGGDTPADIAFRTRLFTAIGSVTAAGGHIEAALKRLLLILSGKGSEFALVDKTWADLEKDLRALPAASSPQHDELVRLLDWAKKRNLRERRHTVVHGAWWPFDGVGARVSRWPRKKSDHTQFGTVEQLENLGVMCWTYARRLDEMLGERWPRAMLLPPEVPEAFRPTE